MEPIETTCLLLEWSRRELRDDMHFVGRVTNVTHIDDIPVVGMVTNGTHRDDLPVVGRVTNGNHRDDIPIVGRVTNGAHRDDIPVVRTVTCRTHKSNISNFFFLKSTLKIRRNTICLYVLFWKGHSGNLQNVI